MIVCRALGLIDDAKAQEAKELLHRIIAMLIQLSRY